ncbi:MAG TPA: YcgL domain-containing protein [Xanthomonadales bacterium]|nr:YcgL domain-containing protein [Xanthomonadales bacterium]
MKCKIYRSTTQAYTYLYLEHGKELEDLPGFLLEKFGLPELIMQLDLDQRKKLAQADIETVKTQLLAKGYYLQLPPAQSVDAILQQHFSQQ